MSPGLIDALWPDDDADAAAASLKVTLHRLEKTAGQRCHHPAGR